MALTLPDPSVLYNVRLIPNNDNLGNSATWTAQSDSFLWQFIPSTKDPTTFLIRTTDPNSGDPICLTTSPCTDIGAPPPLPDSQPGCLGTVVGGCNSTAVAWKLNAWSNHSSDGIYLWTTLSTSRSRLYRTAQGSNNNFLNMTDYTESYVNTTWMKWDLISQGTTSATSLPASIIGVSAASATSASTQQSSSVSSSTRSSSAASNPNTTTTSTAISGKPTQAGSSSGSSPTGAIVGGVVGGVCFLALLAAILYIVRLRHRRNNIAPLAVTEKPPVMEDKPELDATFQRLHEADSRVEPPELPATVDHHELPGSEPQEHGAEPRHA